MIKNILLILLIVLTIFFVSFPFIKYCVLKSHYLKIYSNKVKRLSRRMKFYSLDNVSFLDLEGSKLHADHIIFGSKYIYFINDYFFYGSLLANKKDKTWIYLKRFKNEPIFVENLLTKNESNTARFGKVAKLDNELLVSISLISNECIYKGDKLLNNSYATSPFKLSKLIRKLEAKEVKSINKEQLKEVIEDIKYKNEKSEERN